MDEGGQRIGSVALIGDADTTTADFAFFEVSAEARSRVSPALKGRPTVPRGVTAPDQAVNGDEILLSGYGTPFNLLQQTREGRTAYLQDLDDQQHTVLGPIFKGDSGGPLVHGPTGTALGIVSRLCLGICSEEGPSVAGLISKAAVAGLSVRLRTVQP